MDYCLLSSELKSRPHRFVNQFPFESVMTCKDLLARVCQEGSSSFVFVIVLHGLLVCVCFACNLTGPVTDDGVCRGPDWLPLSFDLLLELPQFVRAFQLREQQ